VKDERATGYSGRTQNDGDGPFKMHHIRRGQEILFLELVETKCEVQWKYLRKRKTLPDKFIRRYCHESSPTQIARMIGRRNCVPEVYVFFSETSGLLIIFC
jgi:hypothetical protein